MKKPGQQGFTVAELLVVIAIIGILTTLVVVNLQRGERSNDLRQAGVEVLQHLRLAQGYSVGGNSIQYCVKGSANQYKRCNDDSDCVGADSCNLGVPLGGYGITVDVPASYNLFANTDNEEFYHDIDDPIIIRKDYFLKGIEIFSFKLGNTPPYYPTDDTLDIIFEPPLGTIHFYVSTVANEENTASLLVKSDYVSNTCRKITVNRISGQMSESQTDCSL